MFFFLNRKTLYGLVNWFLFKISYICNHKLMILNKQKFRDFAINCAKKQFTQFYICISLAYLQTVTRAYGDLLNSIIISPKLLVLITNYYNNNKTRK